MGKKGLRTKNCVKVMWSEKRGYVHEHCCQNKTKQYKIVTDPVKPSKISFREPRVLRSVYVLYSAAHYSTTPTTVRYCLADYSTWCCVLSTTAHSILCDKGTTCLLLNTLHQRDAYNNSYLALDMLFPTKKKHTEVEQIERKSIIPDPYTRRLSC